MHHTKTYRTQRRRWNAATESMSDGQLRREHACALALLDDNHTSARQARFDAIEAEIEHRDCWL